MNLKSSALRQLPASRLAFVLSVLSTGLLVGWLSGCSTDSVDGSTVDGSTVDLPAVDLPAAAAPTSNTGDAAKTEKAAPLPYIDKQLVSSFDGSSQPLRYALPESQESGKRPLLVFLHSWSSNYRLHKKDWLDEALQRGWIFVEPDFRGPNNNPQACGSEAARADILDSVEFAIDELGADPDRIYLAGASGGGHMAMLMAGRHPERFTAVSAWVGISDLAQWHEDRVAHAPDDRYAEMIANCCGGVPGENATVDEQYVERSPVHWITGLGDLPLDLAAGVHDGKSGSVPFQHSIRLFNKIAESRGSEIVRDEEMDQLWTDSELHDPRPEDNLVDPSYGRDIKLRREAGTARVTIFEGGHEGLAKAACTWLETFQRPTSTSVVAE